MQLKTVCSLIGFWRLATVIFSNAYIYPVYSGFAQKFVFFFIFLINSQILLNAMSNVLADKKQLTIILIAVLKREKYEKKYHCRRVTKYCCFITLSGNKEINSLYLHPS